MVSLQSLSRSITPQDADEGAAKSPIDFSTQELGLCLELRRGHRVLITANDRPPVRCILVDKARLDEVGIRQEEEHPEFVLPLAAPSDNGAYVRLRAIRPQDPRIPMVGTGQDSRRMHVTNQGQALATRALAWSEWSHAAVIRELEARDETSWRDGAAGLRTRGRHVRCCPCSAKIEADRSSRLRGDPQAG
jgi:hypothetical protein